MNWTLLGNTVLVGALATLLALAFGTASALWAFGLPGRWQKTVIAASVLALATPPFVVANCWIDLLGQNGAWRGWLPCNIYSLGGTVWLLALLTWPVPFLAVLTALRRMEPELLDADSMLRGAALVRWLALPMAADALRQAAILTFVLAINNFAIPAILQVKVLPAELWVSFNTMFDYKTALLMCWPLVMIPLAGVLLLGKSGFAWNWRSSGAAAAAYRRQLGPAWMAGCGLAAATIVASSVCVPAWQLTASAETWREFTPAFLAGQSALGHSILFAAATATIVMALGLSIGRRAGWAAAWIAFFVPGVLLGIAIIWLFNRPVFGAFYQNAGIVILAYAIHYAAPGWNCAARALASTDPTLADAARLEGAGPLQMLRHVYWPQIAARAAAGWYIVYLLCLWDVEALALIVPPGDETLSLRIFNLLHYGHNAQVNALCLIMAAAALAPLVLWLARAARLPRAALLAAGALCAAGCSESRDAAVTPVNSQRFAEVRVIGHRGNGVGEFNKPRSVAVDTNDNIYVIDMTGRLQKFSPDGAWLGSYQTPQTDKGKAKGMCSDRAGNVVLVEPHYTRVNHFTPDLKLAAQWGVNGSNAGQLAFPRAAAVNSKNEIYISEYSLVERVQKFSARGEKIIDCFGKPGGGPGEFDRPEGMGVDSKDRLYVADSCNHRIQVFSPDDKFLREYGKPGSGPGELSYPYDIRVDASGVQFVCEFGNSRIQIFDTNDKPVEILGGPGGGPGQFSNPWSICLDSKGNLIVADSMNHRVQKFYRRKSA